MPQYIYCNPENESQYVEIVQRMNEPHEYIHTDGTKWRRCFTVPQATIDSKWDAMDMKKCVEKTGNMKGNMGNMYDKAAELSAERTKIMGHDPIKEKKLEQWSKERKGKKYVDTKARKDITVEI